MKKVALIVLLSYCGGGWTSLQSEICTEILSQEIQTAISFDNYASDAFYEADSPADDLNVISQELFDSAHSKISSEPTSKCLTNNSLLKRALQRIKKESAINIKAQQPLEEVLRLEKLNLSPVFAEPTR